MNKIFSLVLLYTVLWSLSVSALPFNNNTFKLMTGCTGSLSCHVLCMNLPDIYNDCSVKTCDFTTFASGGACDGTCNDVLSYTQDFPCKFLCGSTCNFDCSKCRATGPKPQDWSCDGCK
jgi:hypothetical protein